MFSLSSNLALTLAMIFGFGTGVACLLLAILVSELCYGAPQYE